MEEGPATVTCLHQSVQHIACPVLDWCSVWRDGNQGEERERVWEGRREEDEERESTTDTAH